MSVYNGAPHLRQAIDSILSQSFTDFEFIIVDDCSDDETPSILEAYADRCIVKLRNNSNVGLTRSLNRGLSIARGTYVARQDADDVSYPERLAAQVAFLDLNSQVAVLGTAFRQVYTDGRASKVVTMPQQHEAIYDQLLYGHVFCHGSVMLRRHSLEEVGGYNERFPIAQDIDLWLRLAERYRLANLSEVLYQFRMSPVSITGTRRPQQRRFARLAALDALERSVLQPSEASLARYYWTATLDELAEGQKTNALGYLQKLTAHQNAIRKDVNFFSGLAVMRAFEVGPSGLSNDKTSSDYHCGLSFLNELFSLIPPVLAELRDRHKWAISELHAAFAFAAFEQARFRDAAGHCLKAWSHDISQLRNLGLISIFLRSLFISWRRLDRPRRHRNELRNG